MDQSQRTKQNGPGLLPLICIVLILLCGFSASCAHVEECLKCGAFVSVGNLEDPALVESSGLVASQQYPGLFWTHNDSGDSARIFAITEQGDSAGRYRLQGAAALDWEDIAWGPCSDGGWAECLYVGDIGDNERRREEIRIYRVEEPAVVMDGPPEDGVLHDVETFICRYPDGPHDAETLLVDPEEGIPYIITKGGPAQSAVYRFPAKVRSGETVVLVKVSAMASGNYLTAGDVSPDASRVILRDYLMAYEFLRPVGGAFADIFSSQPCRKFLTLERQGEALAIGMSGLDVYTTSEGAGAPIHRAECSKLE